VVFSSRLAGSSSAARGLSGTVLILCVVEVSRAYLRRVYEVSVDLTYSSYIGGHVLREPDELLSPSGCSIVRKAHGQLVDNAAGGRRTLRSLKLVHGLVDTHGAVSHRA
jgi:hypothetical protein